MMTKERASEILRDAQNYHTKNGGCGPWVDNVETVMIILCGGNMNKPKEIGWFFRWIGGGYNRVFAVTREEALAKGNKLGEPNGHMTVRLVVDETTLVADPDGKHIAEEDKRYAGMFD